MLPAEAAAQDDVPGVGTDHLEAAGESVYGVGVDRLLADLDGFVC